MILLMSIVAAVCAVAALWVAIEQLNEQRELRRKMKDRK